jgi:hypothetical protein
MPEEYRLKFLGHLDKMIDNWLTPEMIAAIEPMDDRGEELAREVRKLGPNKALDVYANMFVVFAALNTSLIEALKNVAVVLIPKSGSNNTMTNAQRLGRRQEVQIAEGTALICLLGVDVEYRYGARGGPRQLTRRDLVALDGVLFAMRNCESNTKTAPSTCAGAPGPPTSAGAEVVSPDQVGSVPGSEGSTLSN